MKSDMHMGIPKDGGGAYPDEGRHRTISCSEMAEIERRLDAIASGRVARPRASLLLRLISLHSFLARQRAAGRGWEDLNAILKEGGISTDTATLRSYWARIDAALQHLQNQGVNAPSPDQLLAAVRQSWRKSPPPRAVCSRGEMAPRSARPAPTVGRTRTPMTERNDL